MDPRLGTTVGLMLLFSAGEAWDLREPASAKLAARQALAHRRGDSPAQACFPANFSASALTARGGTNASTLPPSLAISFTILELR